MWQTGALPCCALCLSDWSKDSRKQKTRCSSRQLVCRMPIFDRKFVCAEGAFCGEGPFPVAGIYPLICLGVLGDHAAQVYSATHSSSKFRGM